MNSAVKLLLALLLLVLLVVALYSAATQILGEGGDEVNNLTENESKVFECVQRNPGKSVEWCRENIAAEVVKHSPAGI